jgi:hypothetical protein
VASAAAWVVGGTMSTSGITALAVRVLGDKKKRAKSDSTQRSEDYVDSNERESNNSESGIPGRMVGSAEGTAA